ncbi:MAG: outer membrane beta-barrel protein [Hydrotalea flava]|uniref:porin family protein n=1 Tax=Hydrotalea TaxID=1004300 RepID=UPI001025ABFD|nr:MULTISPECIES: porin family protein [Hydrotalea]MBY0348493.1 PorT family protein [Hydrotalea flava]NIM34763.1 outer membrane beta-barrel protein [Hydrotalea flava]NIM37599.1 outer membrane beta-barrel protein [Hydrotalea flava]NIN02759.1 outer membrane beta-barrel protein [Hydrotalea flava]NIN14444.1 outer membrane beta-barrel protein [Hydrotalea flava]
MKKIIVLTIGVFCLTAIAQAQGFRAGIKAGGNLTKIDGQTFDQGFQLSYQVGGFAEIDFNKKFGIQPELLWSQSATKSATFSGIFPPDQNIKLDYLTIPVLLRYNVGKLVTFNLGPQFGILLNKNDNLLVNGQNAFKSGDFAMVGGVQLNFNVLRIYGRYAVGLNNLNDVSNQNNWKSQQIQMGMGFRF